MSQETRTFMDARGVQRLEAYFQRIGDVLGDDSRRGSFAIYAMGLLGDDTSEAGDDELPALSRSLVTLKDADKVRIREKRHWRRSVPGT